MYNFLPDIYTKSIYTIDYENLKFAGIKVIIFGLDNTIVPLSTSVPNNKLVSLFDDIKKLGMNPVIVSNRSKKRVVMFKDGLFVDAAYKSMKPFSRKYKKIMKLYNVKAKEIACVGNQLFVDIYGANRLGFTTVLVNPISSNDFSVAKITRVLDNVVIRHFSKNEVFKRGDYYE